MPPKKELIDQLISALKDDSVVAAIGGVIERKLNDLLSAVNELKKENEAKTIQIMKIEKDLRSANDKIEAMEAYSRSLNLIVYGLPVANFANAAESGGNNLSLTSTNSAATESQVLDLFNNKMGLPIQKSDISITHKLSKKPGSTSFAPVIVRFTSRKARDLVYSARTTLRSVTPRYYINEDLTKKTSELFRLARKCVKDKKLFSTWTFAGCIYMKKSSQASCKPERVSSAEDLPC